MISANISRAYIIISDINKVVARMDNYWPIHPQTIYNHIIPINQIVPYNIIGSTIGSINWKLIKVPKREIYADHWMNKMKLKTFVAASFLWQTVHLCTPDVYCYQWYGQIWNMKYDNAFTLNNKYNNNNEFIRLLNLFVVSFFTQLNLISVKLTFNCKLHRTQRY